MENASGCIASIWLCFFIFFARSFMDRLFDAFVYESFSLPPGEKI